ncbi:hypothetical protein ONE63_011466 [Megalurothrips usitatus]|uniref:Uncharacterized protein n=1 Tax=Megalurothrips usitatus TaxID=439358 RepID=A0AAV7X4I1_9NEOP|nr:hypothetical protein ONE63_011466 [Megalurothrips usitatus]
MAALQKSVFTVVLPTFSSSGISGSSRRGLCWSCPCNLCSPAEVTEVQDQEPSCLAGKALWAKLAEKPFFVNIPENIKAILQIMGYDNIHVLKCFDYDSSNPNSDICRVETFMQRKLHKILSKGDKKDMRLYYGIFEFCPEEFEFIGGNRHILEAAVSAAKKLLFLRAPISKPAVANSPPEGSKAKADALQKKLEATLSKWVRSNNCLLGDSDVRVTANVRMDGGVWVASVLCPVPECKVSLDLRRTGTSWNTGNFYKHISNAHKHPADPKTKQQVALGVFRNAPKKLKTAH